MSERSAIHARVSLAICHKTVKSFTQFLSRLDNKITALLKLLLHAIIKKIEKFQKLFDNIFIVSAIHDYHQGIMYICAEQFYKVSREFYRPRGSDCTKQKSPISRRRLKSFRTIFTFESSKGESARRKRRPRNKRNANRGRSGPRRGREKRRQPLY